MSEEQKINRIAEKRVKEWIEYAKKEYGWENAQYDLFEEPMFELCVQVATLATEELKEHHKKVCEELTDTHRNLREKIADLESQIEKIKSDIEKLKDGALKDSEFAIYDVLDVLYKHNFEVLKGVSN